MSAKGFSTDWKVAADPENSAWVSANAGAGKTHTLANRVTRLLLNKAQPAKILCLTYTKAAAAEMQGRLFEQLGKWSMLDDAALADAIVAIGGAKPDADGLREARRLFARALETPGGLKIQTIHAFCERLLSRFPLEAGVPPSFQVLDDQTARDLVTGARTKILERAGTGDAVLAKAVGTLVTQTSETRLNQILETVTGSDRRKLEAFFDSLGADADALLREAERMHGAKENETYESVAGDFCGELEKEETNVRELIAWLSGGKKSDGDTGFALTQALAVTDPVARFELYRGGLLTQKGELYKSYATKALADARPELVERLIALATRMHAATERCRAARAAALAHAALVVVHAMREAYAREKHLRGVLDYDDLIAKTLELLDTRPAAAWVLYKLDNGLDHILIDEAQDTSPEQWRIVQKLTEEMFAGESRDREQTRTIFAVGDEKQSIFSFQGAEPEEFERNRAHFEARSKNFAEVRLETSRRSVPEVLAFVDEVFAEETARAGLSQNAVAHKAHRAEDKGRVELWPTLKPTKAPDLDLWRLRPVDVESKTSPVAQLADRVAGQIEGWVTQNRRLPGRDTPIRPGDIMILMPRREPFASEIIRRLKNRNIPVAGADRMKLIDQIAVMDMIALGRFALLPEDDLNLAALLRSPLIDVSEDALRMLAHGRKGDLWRALRARADEDVYKDAAAFLTEMLSRADRSPPYEFYSHALIAKKARHRLLARLGAEAADALDEFLSLALSYEQLHTPSLEGFLHWLERGEAEIKRDMERGRNEVRVMTVHGSKGLEADIVILPDTTALAQGAGRHGEFLFTESGDVIFPLRKEDSPQAVLDAKAEADEAAQRERRRLLYVALTRAKDRLIVCGFESSKGVEPGSWYDLTQRAAKKMGVEIAVADDTGYAIGDVDTEPFTGGAPASTDKITLPAWAREDAKAERVNPRLIRASDAAGLEEPATLSPLSARNARRFERGNLIHALLAHLPEIAATERRERALNFLAARKVNPEDAGKLVDETLAVMNHKDFAAVFAPGSRAEVALVADLSKELGEGARLNGRIDRLAITANDVLVVDFKTNRPPPPNAEHVANVYKAQMALYKAALSKVFPNHRIACALVWTDGPSLMPLPDAMLEAEIGAIRARLDSAAANTRY